MTYTQTAFTGSTGARPITAFTRQLARDLEARVTDGVEITDKAELYRVVEQAAVALGIGIGARETLRHLIGFTRIADWKQGQAPVVWPSNQTLADEANKTVGAIKARLRQLRAANLVQARDSAHGRRTGRREAGGTISSAFGIDLSPIRTRFDELRQRAETYTAQSRLFKEGRQEIARVRRIANQALAQAAEMRLTGAHWTAIHDAIERVAGMAYAARDARDSEVYRAALDLLPGIETQIADTIDRFMFSDDFEGSGSKNESDTQLQTSPSLSPTVEAHRDCSSNRARPVPQHADLPPSSSNSRFKARPTDLIEMFPATADYVGTDTPRWNDVHAATARLRHDLGIRIGTYVDALETLGADATAIAVMITAERYARNEIRATAGAYFAGMVAKAKHDELDLAKSLWGFRTERMALQ